MRTWTNLAWPDDPYRTGQQLYRRPAPRLAAFTVWLTMAGGEPLPATTAVVYLPLHRTRPVSVTGQTLMFGFRAADAAGPGEVPDVAAAASLDLLQARRHAAVLAGYHLAADLAALQRSAGAAKHRGLAAVAGDWSDRSPMGGRAAMFDRELDLPGRLPLGRTCREAGIIPAGPQSSRREDRHPVRLAVERALAIALLCARHQGRYEWDGTVDTEAVMNASAWDCLPRPLAADGTGPAPAAADGQRK